jgi:hypothetical protein
VVWWGKHGENWKRFLNTLSTEDPRVAVSIQPLHFE